MNSKRKNRKGAVAILLCALMLPLLGLLAFSIDYGFLLFVRTDLQRVADQAAIAAVRDLAPNADGSQDLPMVRNRVREYVALNLGAGFTVEDADIEIGRYDPTTIYSSVVLLNDGIMDTVRIRLRRDDVANQSVSLYFARLFGDGEADVSANATAVLQKARFLAPGASILPIALEKAAWDLLPQGETASIYGSGRIEDEFGNEIPGNWGTVDIGPNSNSTAQLSTQIVNGLSQSDLDALYSYGTIPTNEYIDASLDLDLQADTGLSSGIKHAVWEAEGTTKVAPIYTTVLGNGNNTYFKIVGWVSVNLVDSGWNGAKNSYITVRKSYTYDAYLLPQTDLSNTTEIIDAAYTSPVLIQ